MQLAKVALGVACALVAVIGLPAVVGEQAWAADDALMTAASIETQAADYDISWYEGKESPYTISNIKQLKGLAYLVNSGTDSFEGKEVCLAENKWLFFDEGDSIDPIGTQEHPFEGTFDGSRGTGAGGGIVGMAAETRIQNLTLNVGDSLSNVGLFGYAGDNAVIRNLTVLGGDENPVTVTNKADGKVISNVGAIAGHLGGSLINCYSSVDVVVTNNGKVPSKKGTKPDDLCTILGVGGLVGSLGGDMQDCTNAASELKIASTTSVSTDVPFIAGYVGGLVGVQGDVEKTDHVTNISGCKNSCPITYEVNGTGGHDRFGEVTYSVSSMAGGIVGYAMGNISNCSNTAAIQTGVVKDGVVQAGFGASNVGGIVGSLRGPVMCNPSSSSGIVGANETDPGYNVWKDSKGATRAEAIAITNCSNTGDITGLASVAGICGSAGAFTQIVGCSNTAKIEGTRWNKPCPAGIAGISNGDIRYCYNQGRCFSTTGGGYYSAGIVGLLTTYNTSATAQSMLLELPELCGCYVTGSIGGAESGFRTGVLTGENDGRVHDNCVLPNLSNDKAKAESGIDDGETHSRLVAKDENRGTLLNNYELEATEMKSSKSVSYLNKPNARKGDWSLYYVPVPGQYPVLSWQAESMTLGNPVDINTVVDGIGQVTNPEYSAAYSPVPGVQLEASTELYQDADYRIVVADSAREVNGAYKATVQGINGYSGELAESADYSIVKADIDNCTVSSTPVIFNWERQAPKAVQVTDEAGNVVDPSEYTFRTLPNEDGSTKKKEGKYFDYINCHGANYRYDVEVTALESSEHYTGMTVQPAFQIKWASMYYSVEEVTDNPNLEEGVKLGNVVFGNKSWDIKTALKKQGSVKIKYTGSEIKPKCASVTYLGKELRDGTGNSDVAYHPLDYDFKYVYGNPNPETGKDADGGCTDVTGSDITKLGCMTVRFTTGGNFDNYTNVFYEITPASMSSDVKVSGIKSSYTYTGSAIAPTAKLTYNGMTLVSGRDYTVKYANNKNAGTGTITFTGKGNYAGTKTVSFAIAKAKNTIQLAKATRSLKVKQLKKAKKVVAGAKVSKAKGTVVYAITKVNKAKFKSRFTINKKTGKITVKKGTKKGTYKITVKATAKGNANFKQGYKTAVVTVKVVK